MEAADIRFRVMGCDAHVILVGGPDPAALSERAALRLEQLEALWTRFDPSSTISRLNHGGGAASKVDADTIALVLRSRDAWRITGGLFDPTVLPSMVHAGYRTGLDEDGWSSDPALGRTAPAPGLGMVDVDTTATTVRLPPHTQLDAGGIGKGLAADIVAEETIAAGAAGAMINIGGDLRAIGRAPVDPAWTVSLEDPFDADRSIARLHVVDGGVATTTPRHRRWRVSDGPGVHVIDPRTGSPVDTDVASVTVIAAQAWMSEAVTKAVAVAGADRGLDIIEEAGVAGIIVHDDGTIRLSSRAGAFL